jgi:hypothetical protein
MSTISVTIDGITYDVELDLQQRVDADLVAVVNGERLRVSVPNLDSPEPTEWLLVDDRPYEVTVDRNLHWMKSPRGSTGWRYATVKHC